MTDFNAFAPNYSAPADPLAGFHGPTSKGREGWGEEGEGTGGSEGRKGGDVRFFPWADLSTLSTTYALVGWCSDAVLQWLESTFWLNQ